MSLLLDPTVRWALDKAGANVALLGAFHPEQLAPVAKIVRETVTDPVGPGFMAPPARHALALA